MSLNILGINISTDSKQEILKKISGFLNMRGEGEGGAIVVTPNPEFLLAAKKDEEFFFILNQVDLAVPDGIGLTFAGLLLGKFIKKISGIDLMYDICKLAEQQKKSIFLLGGTENTAQQATKKLKKIYPNLQIVGAEAGLQAGEWKIEAGQWKKGESKNKNLELRIKNAKPDIIFVAFGQVKQEKWMFHSLPHLPSVKIGIGIGGSFDFIAGSIRRAPKVMRLIGLEWLWRLLQEPIKRLPRIFNAVIKFPLAFISWKFIKPWLYRPNVVCLLYKKDPAERDWTSNDGASKIKVLLAERRIPAGHWQLPQGGTDGEDLQTAGMRELREEVGTDKFKPIAIFKNLYKYKFGNDITNLGAKSKEILGYKGQKQGLFIAEFTGQDKDITINHWDHQSWKWADLEKITSEVHVYRKEATEIFIEKFKSIL